MNPQIEKIKNATQPLRQQIVDHKVYAAIQDLDDLKIFMQHHVFAVWDFMSLLKSLQNNLTCTSLPWFPRGSGDTRYLINEIVAGEESDVDAAGVRKSHFELYLDAMHQCGADTGPMEKFTAVLQQTGDFAAAYAASGTPAAARGFVDFTFDVIRGNQSHVQAAVFTFGREDLIPGMFISLVNDIHRTFPDSISVFKYYLERHIEVDGDHHSHLALEMTAALCGADEQRWQQAEQATVQSLQKRIDLWDGVYRQLVSRRAVAKAQLV